jgi:ubiquitin carboxyl-terminal hydrolase 34
LLGTSDQSLRNVRKEQVDAIIKSIDQISRRFMVKEERDKQTEVLRLELANKSLKSTYLERRISGIKDLNTVIKNNTLFMSSKTFTTEFLIDWMVSNEVFTTLWDARKTHA